MKRLKHLIGHSVFAAWLLGMAAVSCTNYLDPPPVYENYDLPEDTTTVRKVLMISIDGLVGSELKKELPANIQALLANSKYTFDAFADENTSDPASWTTMMTGVNSARHHIESESYIPEPDPSNSHAPTPYFPSVFYRIFEQNPGMNTVTVTQSSGLANILLMDATTSDLVSGDDQAKNRAVEVLEKTNPDFLLVQFQSVLEAGKASSFSMESADYKAALQTVDEYIGEIRNAMEQRPKFKREEWLLILTSNHGGAGNSYGGSSAGERNTFAIFHNRDFVGQELKPNLMGYVKHHGYDGTSGTPLGVRTVGGAMGSNSDFDLATTGELTIETKMKVNRNQTSTRMNLRGFHQYWESGFFGKDSHTSQSTPGWMYYSAGNNTQVVVSDGVRSARASRERLHSTWYHFTTVLKAEGSSLTIKMFHNGNFVTESVTEGMNIANIKTQDPLMFGYRPNRSQYDDWVDFDLADVRIWNKALSENQVREVACLTEIPTSFPLYANLKGFWRMFPNSAGEIVNEINNGDVMTISGDFQPKIMQYFTPCDDADASEVLVEGIDMAPQIFYWLDISVRDSWGIEGKNFLRNFEIEFIK